MVRGELEGGWDGGSRRGDRYRRQRSVEVRARWAGGGRGGVVQRRWGGDDVSVASRAASRHGRGWARADRQRRSVPAAAWSLNFIQFVIPPRSPAERDEAQAQAVI